MESGKGSANESLVAPRMRGPMTDRRGSGATSINRNAAWANRAPARNCRTSFDYVGIPCRAGARTMFVGARMEDVACKAIDAPLRGLLARFDREAFGFPGFPKLRHCRNDQKKGRHCAGPNHARVAAGYFWWHCWQMYPPGVVTLPASRPGALTHDFCY